MPPHLRRRVDALRSATVPAVWSSVGPTVDAGVLTAIAQACRDEERIRFAVLLSVDVIDSKRFEALRHFLRSLEQRAKIVTLHLVLPLHLFDHQFGITLDAQGANAMRLRVIKRRD